MGWGKCLKINSVDFASKMCFLYPGAGTPVCRYRLQVHLHSHQELAVATHGLLYWRTFTGKVYEWVEMTEMPFSSGANSTMTCFTHWILTKETSH